MRHLAAWLALTMASCSAEPGAALQDAGERMVMDAAGTSEARDAGVSDADPHLDGSRPDAGPADTSPNDVGADAGEIVEPRRFASCDVPIGGQPWSNPTLPEARGGVEEALMRLDLDGAPESFDIRALSEDSRGHIAYALDIPPATLPDRLMRDDLRASGPLGDVVLAGLVRGMRTRSGYDLTFHRRGLQRYYTCSKAYPLTLEGFWESVYDYRAAPTRTIFSQAKCADRRLRSLVLEDVYVAESFDGTDVRETEILLFGAEDGQLDFLVYDRDGNLTDRSQFPDGEGGEGVFGAPWMCMVCHHDATSDPTTRRFDITNPEVIPCP